MVVAEQPVREAISFDVLDDTLYISTIRGFQTNRAIKVNVTVPVTAEGAKGGNIEVVEAGGASSSIVINPGFKPGNSSLVLRASGAATILVRDIEAKDVAVQAMG